MKLKFVLPLILCSSLLNMVQAQITLTAANAPVIGDVINFAIDTLPQNVSIGEAGANQTWDFSALQAHATTAINIIHPAQAPNNEDFPTATFAQSLDDGSYGFAEVSSTGVEALGASLDFFGNKTFLSVIFDPSQTIFTFPTTFGTSVSSTYGFNLVVDGSDFDVDSIQIQSDASQTIETDGYGTLITPAGTYQALRQRIETVTETSLFALFFGTWFPLETSTDTSITYQWLTAEAKGQTLTLDVFGDSILSATWFQSLGTVVLAPVSDFSFEQLGGGEVTFTDLSANNPTEWSWTFGDATTSTLQNPTHTYTASGTYDVCLTATNAGGTSSSCQEVTITIVADEEVEDLAMLKVFPNPADNWISFETGELSSTDLNLTILNLSGQQVLNTVLNGKRALDISPFAKGTYVYVVRSEDGRIVAEGRFEKQ